jgi:ankyrin repeat protein
MTVPEFFKAAKDGNLERLKTQPGWTNFRHEGATPLHFAAIHGRMEAVRWLIQHQANIDARDDEFHMTPLGWANEKGHQDIVRLLLTYSVFVDVWDAVAIGRIDRLSVLLERDADLLAAERNWGGLAHHACIWGRAEVLEWLIARGADYHKRSRDGFTPMEIAERQAADGRTHTPIVTDRRKAEIERDSGRIIQFLRQLGQVA